MGDAGAEMVKCARKKLRLLDVACARFWLGANPDAPPVWQGRHACHGCPAGAVRAGVELDPLQPVRDRLAPICTRCRRTSERIVRDLFCPSCFNRDREIVRGRNAKGQPPRIVARRLFACRVVVIEGGLAKQIVAERAVGPLELVLARARRAKAPVSFGWAPALPLATVA